MLLVAFMLSCGSAALNTASRVLAAARITATHSLEGLEARYEIEQQQITERHPVAPDATAEEKAAVAHARSVERRALHDTWFPVFAAYAAFREAWILGAEAVRRADNGFTLEEVLELVAKVEAAITALDEALGLR